MNNFSRVDVFCAYVTSIMLLIVIRSKVAYCWHQAVFSRARISSPYLPIPNYCTIRKTSTKSLAAILPYDDGIDDYNHNWFSSSLAERIFHNSDKIAQLARLAVAFSPPDQKLSMEHLEHVEIVLLDENHIEIAAAVCETECVSILVPVQFPHSCSTKPEYEMEECVLENVDELDKEAEFRISQMQKVVEMKDKLGEECLTCYDNSFDLPSWWVTPPPISLLQTECRTIQNLLNEDDFTNDLYALASAYLAEVTDEIFEVERVGVSTLGPAGLCLRAMVRRKDGTNSCIVDLPVSFGQTSPASNGDDLRAAVLGLISSVHIDSES